MIAFIQGGLPKAKQIKSENTQKHVLKSNNLEKDVNPFQNVIILEHFWSDLTVL